MTLTRDDIEKASRRAQLRSEITELRMRFKRKGIPQNQVWYVLWEKYGDKILEFQIEFKIPQSFVDIKTKIMVRDS